MIKKHPFHGDSGDLYEFVIFPIGSDFHARLPDVPGVVVFGVASGGGALTPLGFVASVHDMQKDFWDEGYMGSDEFSPPRRYMKKMALHGATHIGYCRDSNFLHLSSDTDARVIGAMMDLRNYYNTDF